jgi:hypothetical protein
LCATLTSRVAESYEHLKMAVEFQLIPSKQRENACEAVNWQLNAFKAFYYVLWPFSKCYLGRQW